ncbi:MAG: LemA family protein [Armatimonadetes bacterium]|jgi:LemA protein|nr:LemA family protein [Armatimonadota bacterium]HOC31105.1 LemA family protein [Armatimonadota bacterium]
MKKAWLTGCGIAVVVALILAALLVGPYNKLVTQDQAVKKAWAGVENQLKRRADLIPNLVGSVKGIAQQEKDVFGAIADARARIGSAPAGNSEERIKAEGELSSALSRLLMVVENYPQLKSSENFLALQDEVTGTENRLAHEREQYNRAVNDYNTMAKAFPTVLYARLLGFKAEQPYFEAPAADRQRPNVDFSK